MSRPESVSSNNASFGCSTASWSTSLRFFSPPEKPSLTERFRKAGSISTDFAFSLTNLRKAPASISGSPRCLRMAL